MVRFLNPLRRLFATDAQNRALQRNESGGLCERCASIDFNQFLHPGPVSYRGEGKVLDLDELRGDSNCPVCRLFATQKYASYIDDILPPPEQHAGHSAKLCPAFNAVEEYTGPEEDETRPVDSLWPTWETPKSYGLVIVSNAVLRHGQDRMQTQDARDYLSRFMILPGHEGSTTFGLPPGEVEGARINEHGVNYPRMLDWLQRCDGKHSGTCCRLEKRFAVPIDCIDCFTKEIVTMNEDAEYVVLSYTWGTVTYPKAAGGIKRLPDDDELPRVIRDAMAVVRGLGRRHLWVDQYCIDQSDQDAKARQILQMDVVYEQAYATIVAGAGADADFGLPG